MTRATVAVGLAVLVAAASAVVTAKARTQSDPAADFTRLHTWRWNPNGPGDVKVWVSSQSDPAPVKRMYEPLIMREVEQRLAEKKFTRSDSAPDFLVTYYLLVTVGASSQQAGQFLPSTVSWGLPPFAPQTTALSISPQGAVVLDVTTAPDNRIVWRGISEKEVSYDTTDAQRQDIARKAIKEIVDQFPPKKK